MELILPKLERTQTKALNLPFVRNKGRLESFCESCKKHSIKWGFCFICGLEVK